MGGLGAYLNYNTGRLDAWAAQLMSQKLASPCAADVLHGMVVVGSLFGCHCASAGMYDMGTTSSVGLLPLRGGVGIALTAAHVGVPAGAVFAVHAMHYPAGML